MPTITVADGRELAYEEWGDPAGQVLFWLHGTPGGRLVRHSDPTLWPRLGLRVITIDRPGYGRSTPLPGRLVAHAAEDVAAVADHLGVDRFTVQGTSGGGPYALAVAALLPNRVSGCVAVCSIAPITEAEESAMVAINRESFRIWRTAGPAGLTARLVEIREQILADPYGIQLRQLADAPEVDREWLARPDVQQVAAEGLVDALRPGVDGWVADATGFVPGEPWGFDLASIRCPTHFWHSDDDSNAPLSAARRVADAIPGARLTVWHGEGHTAPSRHAEQVLIDLLGVAA